MDFINSLLPAMEQFRILGYVIIFLVSFLESLAFVGIAVPGIIFVILVGFISANGFFDLADAILFVAIGAIAGDAVSYYLGSHAKALFKDDNRIFKSKYLERGRSFLSAYGGRSILFGRFVGPLRPIVPFAAGMFKMDRKKFILWNIFSGFVYAATFLLLGFFFGQAWETVVLWSARASAFLAIFFGFIAALYVFRWLVVKKGKQAMRFFASIWRSVKEAIVHNDDVQKMVKKHPVFFGFIKGRFDRSRFLGMPTTLLFIAFVYTFFLFVGIVEDIVTAEAIVSVDTRVVNLLAALRSAEMTRFFLWVTLLGKWQVVSSFVATTAIVLWTRRKRLYIAPLVLAVLGSEIFTALGKIALHRPRPELAVYTEHSFSFPSGHATIAVAFYGFLSYILIRSARRYKMKVNLFFAGLAVILFIGFSRLYLGVHYVSDVWGGYLVGTLWLIISISISEWIGSKKKEKETREPSMQSSARGVSFVAVALSLLFYIAFALNYNPQISQPQTIQKETVVQDAADIFSSENLKYTETLTGAEQEPISFVILADGDKELLRAFSDAGWYLADKVNISSITEITKSAILREQYLRAPMTPSFWNKHPHNFGFEKPTKSNNVRQRHHARFWKTGYMTEEGKMIYVGTVSLDVGIKWGITHKIDPDIDTEREFLFGDMKNANTLSGFEKQKFVKPTLGSNFSGDLFFTDGKAYIIDLSGNDDGV